MPVGIDRRIQELVRVTRVSRDEYRTEDIAHVRFVPLVGKEGWAPEKARHKGQGAAAVAPLDTGKLEGLPDTYPFGL